MIAFLVTALVTGIVIVYVLPWLLGLLNNVPGAANLNNNKIFHLFIVGAVVWIALVVFLNIARKVE